MWPTSGHPKCKDANKTSGSEWMEPIPDRGGSRGRGGGILGVRTPLLGDPPNFIQREKTDIFTHSLAITEIIVSMTQHLKGVVLSYILQSQSTMLYRINQINVIFNVTSYSFGPVSLYHKRKSRYR